MARKAQPSHEGFRVMQARRRKAWPNAPRNIEPAKKGSISGPHALTPSLICVTLIGSCGAGESQAGELI
jgi:hypothetical protein